MTKDVLITVSGMQFDIEDEPIELVTTGTYYLKNGKHYVLYEEQPEDNGPVTRNLVKFCDGHFEMTKKGGNNSFLLFDINKLHCLKVMHKDMTKNEKHLYTSCMGHLHIPTYLSMPHTSDYHG